MSVSVAGTGSAAGSAAGSVVASPPAPKPHKHRSFTVEFKVGVVEWVEHHSSSVRGASLHFGLDRKVVRSWMKQKQALKEALQVRGAGTRKLHGGRGPTSSELDRQVLEYAEKAGCGHGCGRGRGRGVRDKQLREVARECAEKLGVDGFKASGSWLRGWKERCRQEQQTSQTEDATTPSSVLSTLTDHDKEGVVCSLDNQQTTRPSIKSQVSSEWQDPADSREAVHSGAAVDSRAAVEGSTDQDTGPEHNYSTSPHQHVVTPTSEHACRVLTPPSECTAPSCLHTHMEELLGGVALLRPGEQEDKLDLMALEDEVGGAVEGIPHPLDHLHLHQGLTPHSAHHSGCHAHPGCHVPPALLEGEDPMMALFNHRSFTDHFPFLPPSLYNSNWCPPYDSSRGIMDNFMQAAPLTYSDAGLVEGAVMGCKMGSGRVPGDRYLTRSKAQAQAAALARASPSPVVTPALTLGSRWVHTPTPSPSPSPLDSVYSPTRQAGGTTGGVALLTPPTGVEGSVVASPPGGGLLANRRFQPIFPDEPEIVFHEIQLGPLHTTPQPRPLAHSPGPH